MRVLALDYGAARIGCALCDPTETLVRPVDVISPPDVGAVAAAVAEHEAEGVVVGIPVSLDGTEGEQARVTREFCEELAGALDVPVDTYDERLTTRMAQASRRAGAKGAEDSIAAAHLLEAYLAARERAGIDDGA